MYFLKSTKELVENGTNFKKLTNKKNTDNYINTMAYVGENNDFSSYLFYINFMSTIQPTQSSDSSTSTTPPSVYFTLKALE